jgi:ribonucleoside-diphosphate reductase subunit M1
MLYGEGAPILRGEFQWKMWGLTKENLSKELNLDWDTLADHIARWGVHNSLLTAPMPTASTSQIMGVTESFEPCTSNLYKRKTLAGEFIVINPYLVYDLIELGIWNEDLENYLKKYDGSVQNITGIPEYLKQLYKTVWEIPQRKLINQAADRGPFIDHSQSLNLFLANPTSEQVSAMLRYAWKKGLKSTYYLRSQPAINPQKFTLKESVKNDERKFIQEVVIEAQQPECLLCSS